MDGINDSFVARFESMILVVSWVRCTMSATNIPSLGSTGVLMKPGQRRTTLVNRPPTSRSPSISKNEQSEAIGLLFGNSVEPASILLIGNAPTWTFFTHLFSASCNSKICFDLTVTRAWCLITFNAKKRSMRDQNQYLLLATKIGTHPDLLGEGQFADTSFRCLPGSQFRTDKSKAVSQPDQVAISAQGRGRGLEMFHPVQPSRRRLKLYVRVHLIVLLVFNKGFPLGHCIRWELPPQTQGNVGSVRHAVSSTHLNRLSHSSCSTHGSPPRPVVNRIGSSASLLLPSSSQRKSHTFDCLQRWTGQTSSQDDELRDAVQTFPPMYTRFELIQNDLNCRMSSSNFSKGKLGRQLFCLRKTSLCLTCAIPKVRPPELLHLGVHLLMRPYLGALLYIAHSMHSGDS
ncbi:hypothetical protein T06_12714 [Trichinella sp. T6]|nr:hypothetical protein T06_12714 [Trichinella sp. T6]